MTKTKKQAAAPSKVERAQKTKMATLEELLRRPAGATLEELRGATGWQAHSVRGAMSGLKKKLGLTITSTKSNDGRTYRLSSAAQS